MDRSGRILYTTGDMRAHEPDAGLGPTLVLPLVGLAVAIGAFFSLDALDHALLFGDEFWGLLNLEKPYAALIRSYDVLGNGAFLPVAQRLSIDLFGVELWAYRLPIFLGTLGTLLVLYPAARRLVGEAAAVVATLALALNAIHIFYSGFSRPYSVATGLSVVLVWSLAEAVEREPPARRWYALAGLCAGLIPWVHLTAAALVLAVSGAAFAVLWRRDALRTHGPWLLGSLAGGAVLCAALLAPAWSSLSLFVSDKAGRGDYGRFGPLDVVSLLAGSRALGLLWLAAVPASLVALAFARRSAAILLGAALFGQVAALFAVRPHGMTYAYARYLLPTLPFALMLIAWGVVQIPRLAGLRGATANRLGLALGLCCVAASFRAGPLGAVGRNTGPFSNSYLSMMPLPAFDVPWPEAPAFYHGLAGSEKPLTLIEAPAIFDRGMLLYRSYQRLHGQDVIMGSPAGLLDALPDHAYASLESSDFGRESGADFLVVHRDLRAEAPAYWRFVYDEVWAGDEVPALRSLMERQRQISLPLRRTPDDLIPRARSRLGEPVYQDDKIVVWQLRR